MEDQPPSGFLNRSLRTAAGRECRYVVYVPASYREDREWPAALFLHGVGERGEDGLLQTEVGIGTAIRRHWPMIPLIVVLPQCGPDSDWRDPEMEEMALLALDRTLAEYRIDRRRIYLTGLSMGGIGAWRMAARHPRRFAAIVPVCGIGEPATQAPALKDTPVWCFHGAVDAVIPAARSREMVQALERAGGKVKYTEYPGVGHDSWTTAYSDPELYLWLLAQRREAGPDHGR